MQENSKQAQQSFRLAFYLRKFIHQFTSLTNPLSDLINKNITFEFKLKEKNLFELTKKLLIKDTILKLPNLEKNSSFFVMHQNSA